MPPTTPKAKGFRMVPRIRDTSPTVPRLDPAKVAEALGANPVGIPLTGSSSPLSRSARAIGHRTNSPPTDGAE